MSLEGNDVLIRVPSLHYEMRVDYETGIKESQKSFNLKNNLERLPMKETDL